MSLGLTILFLIYTIYRYLHNKPTIALLMGWMIISPCLRIGGQSIDSTYLIVIVLFFAIILIKGKIIIPNNKIIKYIEIFLGINVLFILSWLLFNRNDASTALIDFFGALKISLLLLETLIMNYNISGICYKKQIELMIWGVAILNVLAVLYEMYNFNGSISLLSNYIFNDAEIYYLESMTKYGQYQRYFGLFGYPMKLGLFSIYSLTFVSLENCITSKIRKMLLMVILMYLGLMSSSKTFILGCAILLIFYIITTFLEVEKNKNRIIYGIIAIGFLFIVWISYSQISDLIASTLGTNVARYFEFLGNIQEIFTTRFSSESGVLATSNLYEVIKENIIFGVGSSSIAGEPVMDNAFLVIIHNGGLIGIIIVVIYYLQLLFKCRQNSSYVIILIIILATGMGFQTWLAPESAWLLVWGILANNDISKNN